MDEPVRLRIRWMNWSPRLRWSLALVYWLFLNWMLFAPAKALPDIHLFGGFQDKLGHLILFSVFAAMVRWSIPGTWGRGMRRVGVVATLLAYGMGTEYIQAAIPNAERMFEVGDIVMDCVGVALGTWMCGWLAENS